jgi:hypothetical protein
MTEEGGDDSLPAGIDAPTATPAAVARCEVTGNPCGTDTWAKGTACSCAACQAWLAHSPTLTVAKPEEVVSLERHRLFTIEAPTADVTIVAVGPPPAHRPKCEWENCAEPSVGQWRWRREAADGVRDAFDFATYCDGHGNVASTHGAVLKERFT